MLALAAAALFSGLLIATLWPHPWQQGFGLIALALGVLGVYVSKHTTSRLWSLGQLAALLAAGLALAPRPHHAAPPRGTARLVASVQSVRWSAQGPRGEVLVSSAEGVGDAHLPASGSRLRLQGLDAPPGSRVQLLARLRPAETYRNPSPHPRWLNNVIVHGEGRLLAPARVLRRGAFSPVHDARNLLRRRLQRQLSPAAAGLARALLLGDRSAPPDTTEAFRASGLAHLLAVSGLHVSIAIAFFVLLGAALARRFGHPEHRWRLLFGAPAAVGFLLLSGGQSSATRATVMALLVLGLQSLRRRPQVGAILGCTALLFAFGDPAAALRPAFLLSLSATAALLLGEIPASPLAAAWQLTWRSTLATMPIVLWCFGSLPPGSLAANVLLVPLGTLMLIPLAFALGAFGELPVLGACCASAFERLTTALTFAADAFAFGQPLPPPDLLQGALLVGLALAGLRCAGRNPKTAPGPFLVVAALLLALGGAELWLRHREAPEGTLRLSFLDVGQGDSALIDLPDGRLVLIDAGLSRPGHRALRPLLQARRRSRIDLAILSHPHPDHYGGLTSLIDEVAIDELWISGQGVTEHPHGPAARLSRAWAARGTRVREANEVCGTHRLGDVGLEVLWPCPAWDPGLDPNDNSLVVRIVYGEQSVLFTGDAEALAEAALEDVPHASLRADVLKVPHHGSRTSSSDAFLDLVRPKVAIASMGQRSRYGHPHPEVLARFNTRGIRLLRTDLHGGVVLEGDGQTWREVARGVP